MDAEDIVQALDPILDRVEEVGKRAVMVKKGSVLYDALGLARAVASLIDFGGGTLVLPDEQRFRLVRPCEACENAAKMFTRAGLESKFCVRCANDLAEREWKRR